MSTLLVSHRLAAERGADLAARVRALGAPLQLIALPADRDARLSDPECARIETALFSEDIFPDRSRQFFSALRKAPRLQWLHVFNVGVDHPIYTEMLRRGVRLTTSAGTTAKPIAQNAVAGLLMLARQFPRSIADQREHRWNPRRGHDAPRDLEGQTVVIVGLGHIGREVARLARALGLRVIGVRRSARTAADPVDALYTPDRLHEALPHADWLVLACPLTARTRGLIDAAALARLPAQSGIINVARGEIVDEAALIAALRSGHLAGAYLDVFQQEPLPPDSPLWDLPNVVVTPHHAAVASGNDRRVYEVFVENLARRHRGVALLNEVTLDKQEEG